MCKDRRIELRENAGRRRSDRISDYKAVSWRQQGKRTYCDGWLVDWSAHGVGLVMELKEVPAEGTVIYPKQRPDLRAWRRPAVVRRIEPLSDLLYLVAAEYTEAGRRTGARTSKRPRPALTPDAHSLDDNHEGGSASNHRVVNRPLQWRVDRGRKVREALLVGRSDRNVILLTDDDDVLSKGMRLRTGAPDEETGLGFESMVIERVEDRVPGSKLVYAEIEK
jgi:hypothetical protein